MKRLVLASLLLFLGAWAPEGTSCIKDVKGRVIDHGLSLDHANREMKQVPVASTVVDAATDTDCATFIAVSKADHAGTVE